jgi:tetratricopeptide (TPR) repeat protein
LGDNYPRRLLFKIVNPTRIHNIELNYDAFKIVCPTQELAEYQKTLDERQKVADSDLSNLRNQRELSNIFETIADVLLAQGHYQDALDDYIKGLAIRKKLAISEPGDQKWQRDLSVSYERVGQVQQILEQPTEALDAFKSSLEIRQKLYLANRGAFLTQHDLADIYEKAGNVLKILNNNVVALQAYKISLPLRQGLADANPSNSVLQGELAISLYLTSTVSDAAAAKDALSKALQIVETLEKTQKLAVEQAGWPAFLRGEIAKLP